MASDHEVRLTKALYRMVRMYEIMMEKVNHGASAYDAECIREMNEAPIQAGLALKRKDPHPDIDRGYLVPVVTCDSCSKKHLRDDPEVVHHQGAIYCNQDCRVAHASVLRMTVGSTREWVDNQRGRERVQWLPKEELSSG